MGSEIITGLLALLGTMFGTFGGILTSNKLTNHRLQELEKKVDKHNSVVERTYRLEEQMKVANHRIHDLEELQK